MRQGVNKCSDSWKDDKNDEGKLKDKMRKKLKKETTNLKQKKQNQMKWKEKLEGKSS